MKKRFLLLLLLCSTFSMTAPTAVWAEMMHNRQAKVQMTVPQGWKMSIDDGMTTVATKDDLMMVMFWAVEEDELEVALEAWYTELHKMMANIKETHEEPQEIKINGFDALQMAGSGVIEGVAAKWDTTIILASTPLIMVTISFKGAPERYGKELKSMLASLKAKK